MADRYTVQRIIEAIQITPEGDVVKVHKVSARTGSGEQFTVEIPEAEFSQEEVARRLTERTQIIEGIKGL